MNTEDEDDLAAVDRYCAEHGDFFVKVESPTPYGRGMGGLRLASFWRLLEDDPKTIYLRFDDDIVWMADDAIQCLLDFRIDHPEFFLVFANTLNNSLCSHLHQRLGALPPSPFLEYTCCGEHSWRRWETADEVHRRFFEVIETQQLDRFKFQPWELVSYERFSINCMAWFGEDNGTIRDRMSDSEEICLTEEIPRQLGRRNVIVGDALVSHFAYYPQREALEANTEWLSRYWELARSKGILGRKRERCEVGTKRPEVPARERFLILARRCGGAAADLLRVTGPLGKVEVVVDEIPPAGELPGDHVWIPDEEAEAFVGATTSAIPDTTAWERALAHLEHSYDPEEAVWFVEEDVAGDAEDFTSLLAATRRLNPGLAATDVVSRGEEPGWHWWELLTKEDDVSEPWRAFVPLCRLRPELVREVLQFRKDRGRMLLHEILFASLAKRSGMLCLDWKEHPRTAPHLGAFRFRPEVDRWMRGISHPVKDGEVHRAICERGPDPYPRIGRAGFDGWSILADDYRFLVSYCRENGIKRVVEFGTGDSTLAFLDAGCEVMSFEHSQEWLHKVAARFFGEGRLTLDFCSENAVPGREVECFQPDLVFVDGPPLREEQTMSWLGPCEWALEQCGRLLLHDAKRPAEQATLAEMERRGMKVVLIDTEKGLALVEGDSRRP
ncbi:putative O-methyltransferase YrrM [Haloferula luteola]|uniref:Putative O-methyltransferase YrrM n=1 Tax=Haloferula luteola TaxID=595692 RepID=A0A840VDY2_9BACT|nr:hypothetical protein [Haloferula luteola]MBB5353714.1 putative O-methyltransferase YrrM [Haloferula luteola]